MILSLAMQIDESVYDSSLSDSLGKKSYSEVSVIPGKGVDSKASGVPLGLSGAFPVAPLLEVCVVNL